MEGSRDSIHSLMALAAKFRDARDWKQFHNPKDMALSLSLEAEKNKEQNQWKSIEEMDSYVKSHRSEIGDELADVLYWVLLMAHDLKIDIPSAYRKKMKKNAEKYPVKKAKGRHTKYTGL